MKNIITIAVYIFSLYAFKAGATEYDTKVISDMTGYRIAAIKMPMQADSIVWLCVKGVYTMPKINDTNAVMSFYYELKDTNLNTPSGSTSPNFELKGVECDSYSIDNSYIFRKIATEGGLHLIEK